LFISDPTFKEIDSENRLSKRSDKIVQILELLNSEKGRETFKNRYAKEISLKPQNIKGGDILI
jgi:hypothetical protein